MSEIIIFLSFISLSLFPILSPSPHLSSFLPLSPFPPLPPPLSSPFSRYIHFVRLFLTMSLLTAVVLRVMTSLHSAVSVPRPLPSSMLQRSWWNSVREGQTQSKNPEKCQYEEVKRSTILRLIVRNQKRSHPHLHLPRRLFRLRLFQHPISPRRPIYRCLPSSKRQRMKLRFAVSCVLA